MVIWSENKYHVDNQALELSTANIRCTLTLNIWHWHWGIARPIDNTDNAVGCRSRDGRFIPIMFHLYFKLHKVQRQQKNKR